MVGADHRVQRDARGIGIGSSNLESYCRTLFKPSTCSIMQWVRMLSRCPPSKRHADLQVGATGLHAFGL